MYGFLQNVPETEIIQNETKRTSAAKAPGCNGRLVGNLGTHFLHLHLQKQRLLSLSSSFVSEKIKKDISII